MAPSDRQEVVIADNIGVAERIAVVDSTAGRTWDRKVVGLGIGPGCMDIEGQISDGLCE